MCWRVSRECWIIKLKRDKGSAGECDKGKKAKTDSDASSGKYVSEKSQPTGGKVSEKSHVTVVTRTSKKNFQKVGRRKNMLV